MGTNKKLCCNDLLAPRYKLQPVMDSIYIAEGQNLNFGSVVDCKGFLCDSTHLEPYAILYEDCDTTNGAKEANVLIMGEFNIEKLVFGADATGDVLDKIVFYAKKNGIIIRPYDYALSFTPPEVSSIEKVIPEGTNADNKLVNVTDLDEATAAWDAGYTPKGPASVSTLNGLSGQENGDRYVLTDGGTLTDGSVVVVAGDEVAWDAINDVWYKVNQYALEQFGTNRIKDLTNTATESDIASGNYLALDGSLSTKKLPSWKLAKYSSVCAKTTGTQLTITASGADKAENYIKKWINGRFGSIDVSIADTVATFTEIRVYVAVNANLSGLNKLVGKVLYSDFVADKTYGFYFENEADYNFVVIRAKSLNGSVVVSSTCYEDYVFDVDFQDRPTIKRLVVDGYNKASGLSWTSGYEVYRANLNKLRVTASYSVLDITVKKGDVLIYTYDRELTETAAPISRKLSDGTSTSAYQPLTPPKKASSYFYIFEENMDVTLCKSNSGTVTLEWYESENNKNILDFDNELFVRFRPENIANIVKPMKRNPTSGSTAKQKPLTLLHFSDIHDNLNVPYHIKDFMDKYGAYVDDVICTGDITGKSFTDYRPVYDLAGFNKWLLCIGNHDVYDHNGDATSHGAAYDDPAYWATDSEKFQQYFANNIAGWNVTYQADKCYYYKDYDLTSGADSSTVSTLRLIVLDAMAYDATQHIWLESVLTDAKSNGYAVVIADHFPPTETDTGDYTLFDTPFASKMTGMEMWYGLTRLGYLVGDTRYTAASLVDNFIDAGGEFVCWLCGHLHYAQVGTLNSHPRQIFIAIETASTNPVWNDVPRVDLDDSEDLFNLVNIDTFNKVIRVARIGAKYDYLGQLRNVMSIDYSNRTLISG